MRKLVGAVGIGLKATLKTRKLLIALNAENAKNTEFAQVVHGRYTDVYEAFVLARQAARDWENLISNNGGKI